MKRYLIVANQTLGSDQLLEALFDRRASERPSFHVIVPATPPPTGLTWTQGAARAQASSRLRHALRRFRGAGLDVTGEVADANPLLAVHDALRKGSYDEVIVSTFSPSMSRWLKQDLPSRIRKRFGVAVAHVNPTGALRNPGAFEREVEQELIAA